MFQRLLKRTARELKRASIPYMVIGGQAVLLYGEPSLTRDIDITLGIGVNELNKVKRVVSAIGLKILVKDEKVFVEKTRVLPTMEKESNIRIDFIFSFSSYERQAITRAKEVKLGRTFVRFASLEDVIIHKIVSGRPRDLEDIKSILIKNPNYDSNYISAWLEEFDQSLKENFGKRFKEHEETIK